MTVHNKMLDTAPLQPVGSRLMWPLIGIGGLFLAYLVAKVAFLFQATSRVEQVLALLWTYPVMMAFFLFFRSVLREQRVTLCTETPSVSLVVCCFNEGEGIRRTVQSCLSQGYANLQKIIVIDDGSTDGITRDILREVEAEYGSAVEVLYKEKNQGKRHGMYDGYHKVDTEYVIFVDSDTVLGPNFVHWMLTSASQPGVGGAVANIKISSPDTLLIRLQKAIYARGINFQRRAESSIGAVSCLSGCGAIYRKEALDKVMAGWPEESFWGKPVGFGDDRSLTNRVLLQGYRTVYQPNATVYTDAPQTFQRLMKQQIRWKKGWFINSLKVLLPFIRLRPGVALMLQIPYILSAVLTPFIVLHVLYNSLTTGTWPTYWVGSMLLLTTAMYACTKVGAQDAEVREAGFLDFIGSALFTIGVLSMLIVPALAQIQKRGWGTR
ncbi:glycosyltransferase [Deinococcus sp. SDU3-2]|uniref:Glycosyltransferase n=1 Tax=Deinococcus terrestris TaxID=2651870 RepID=A0A7X1NVF1_9DEIO|nr:glycosyltransferase family 2 protein [Deinococcus terrestris]MPY66393.1 glycosyltransferase [Deinococcus terrestris]